MKCFIKYEMIMVYRWNYFPSKNGLKVKCNSLSTDSFNPHLLMIKYVQNLKKKQSKRKTDIFKLPFS